MDDSGQGGHQASSERIGTLATVRRLWRWTRPHQRAVWIMFAAATGAMLAQSLVPLVIGAVVDGPIRRHDTSELWPLCGVALALGIAEAALFFVRRWAMADAALGIETDLRRDVFAHLQRLPVSFHDRWPSGQLLSRLTTDLSTLRRFVGFAVVFLVANTIAAVVVLVLLIHIQVWLGLFVLVAMIPLMVFTRRFELRYSRDARRAQDLTGDIATTVEESALGIRVIKSYGRRPHMLAGFADDARRLRGAELTKIRTLGLFWAVLEAWPQLVLAASTVGGVYALVHGALSLGHLVAFLTLYLQLIWPIVSLGWLLALAEEAASAARRLFEVLDTEPSIVDPASPVASGTDGALRFEDVRFRYDGAETDVLHGFDLDIAAGETMALVGAVGSGKTTVTALVPRLYDVHRRAGCSSGGVDVRDLSLNELRHTVSTAFEDATLFSTSVRENLTLGRPGIVEDDVLEAPGRRAGAVRPRPARGSRHPHRRAGSVTVRRPATAPGAGPSGARPTTRPRPGRPAVRARRAHRVRGRAGAASPGAARHHRARRRAPRVDRAAGRPRRRARRRSDRRGSARTASCSPPNRSTATCSRRTPTSPMRTSPIPGPGVCCDDGDHDARRRGPHRRASAAARAGTSVPASRSRSSSSSRSCRDRRDDGRAVARRRGHRQRDPVRGCAATSRR